MFLVPIAMNIAVAALFVLRMWWIAPWYWDIVLVSLRYPSSTNSFEPSKATWLEIGIQTLKRALVMLFDFLLFAFVWPWPVEFVLGGKHGSPVRWRWAIGYRDKEVYVRRSREWDAALGDVLKNQDSMQLLAAYVKAATSPLLQEQKTGYLLMDGHWDLDWVAMMEAHAQVDKKNMALETFKNVILVYSKDFGWVCYDIKVGDAVEEDTHRREVFAFRDALTALDKEDLFYRWVETVQYESSQPGGFGPEKQEQAAKKIRQLFEAENINFDELWKDAVGNQ